MLVSFEGLPGAGKSTLIKKIRDIEPNCVVLPEPLEKISYLQVAFAQSKYDFHLQLDFMIKRMQMYLPYQDDILDPHKIVITERTLLTEKCVFVKYCHTKGSIDDKELELLNHFYDFFNLEHSEMIVPDKIVSFRISVDTALERIKQRGRQHEEKKWNRTNMEELNRLYQHYLGTCDDMGIPIYDWHLDSSTGKLLEFLRFNNHGGGDTSDADKQL